MSTVANEFDKFIQECSEDIYNTLDNDDGFDFLCSELRDISDNAYDLSQRLCSIAVKTAYKQGFFNGLKLSRN